MFSGHFSQFGLTIFVGAQELFIKITYPFKSFLYVLPMFQGHGPTRICLITRNVDFAVLFRHVGFFYFLFFCGQWPQKIKSEKSASTYPTLSSADSLILVEIKSAKKVSVGSGNCNII